jgi:hypothetical protein
VHVLGRLETNQIAEILLIASIDKKKVPPPSDLEITLAETLSEYERRYYEKVSSALDQDAEQAKQIVEQARTFIRDSRLAYAICRPVLEHVKHWPSWSKRPDFHDTQTGLSAISTERLIPALVPGPRL